MSDRPQRILVIAAPGDARWPTTAVFAGLLRRGWDAHLALPAMKTTEWMAPDEFKPGDSARVHPLRPRRSDQSVSPRRFDAKVRSLHPALMHFLGADHAAEAFARATPSGTRLVVTLAADDVNLTAREDPDRYLGLCQRADAVVFPDHALEIGATKRGLPAGSRQTVIPPAVGTDFFAPDPGHVASTRIHIVSIDQLEWMPGFEHAIHAVHLLREAGVDCHYTIAGDGSYATALTYAAHQLGVDGAVSFVGRLNRPERRALLATSDVFLSASVVDGLPRGLPEAMAIGLPVVMTTPGAVGAEGPGPEATATVRRRDPFALADALRAVTTDAERRARMGVAARQHACEHFAIDRHVDALDELYRSLLSAE